MTLTDLARGLHISKGQASKLAARGMPTSSIDAAIAWRKSNLDPAWAKIPGSGRVEPIHLRGRDALARITRLALAAHAELGTPGLASHLPGLRIALKAIPAKDRPKVAMPVEIWDALTLEVAAEVGTDGNQRADTSSGPDLDAAECAELGAFWYSAAAGETVPNKERAQG